MTELTATFGSPDSAERQRLHLRDLCLRSTYNFGTFVCGFKDLDPSLHGAMAAWIEDDTRSRKLGIAPRGHLKSSIWTVADLFRRATLDPQTRILIYNETIDHPIKWITFMQDRVFHSHYRWLFPEVVPDLSDKRVRWNQTQLELKRENRYEQPTVEGRGVTGSRTGDHYDRVHEDDLIGEEARLSKSVMERAISQHKLSESMLIRPSDPITTVGTRWDPLDVIDDMLRTEADLDVFFLSCWKPDGSPIWPARYDRESLEALRIKYGPALFGLLYENRVVAGGATEFDPKLLGNWHWVPGEEELTLGLVTADGTRRRNVRLSSCALFQVLDAGLSPESQNARTANVVVALTPPDGPTRPFDIVLLDAKPSKVDPAGAVERAVAVYQMRQPVCLAVEVVGGHETFFYWIASEFPEVRVRKLKTDRRKSKETRIREFYPFVAQGRVYINRATTDGADFLEEFESFPKGLTVDLLDALAYAPQIWGAPPGEKGKRPRPPGVTDFDLADDLDDKDFMGPGQGEGRNERCGY